MFSLLDNDDCDEQDDVVDKVAVTPQKIEQISQAPLVLDSRLKLKLLGTIEVNYFYICLYLCI